MKASVAQIIESLEDAHGGAADSTVKRLAKALRISLPKDYTEYLQTSNGAAGPLGKDGWIVLWNTDEVIKFNEGYDVAECIGPGFVLFGTDGGDKGYAFDTHREPFAVVSLSLSCPEKPAKVAASFRSFLHKLAGQS